MYVYASSKAIFEKHSVYLRSDRSSAQDAEEEFLGQAVVGYINTRSLLSSQRASREFDFRTCSKEDLMHFAIPFEFRIETTALMDGLAAWFDSRFIPGGKSEGNAEVLLRTAPDAPPTHWCCLVVGSCEITLGPVHKTCVTGWTSQYQCRFLLRHALAVNAGQSVKGVLRFDANDRSSYDVKIEIAIVGTDVATTGTVRLEDQYYQYMSDYAAATPEAWGGAAGAWGNPGAYNTGDAGATAGVDNAAAWAAYYKGEEAA